MGYIILARPKYAIITPLNRNIKASKIHIMDYNHTLELQYNGIKIHILDVIGVPVNS